MDSIYCQTPTETCSQIIMPNQVKKSRPKLNYDIDKMDEEELRIALEKKAINQYVPGQQRMDQRNYTKELSERLEE